MLSYFDRHSPQPTWETAFTLEFKQAIAQSVLKSEPHNSTIQRLLDFCNWQILLNDQVELVITCSNTDIRNEVIRYLLEIAMQLKALFGAAKIRVVGGHYPFETTTEKIIQYYRC